MFVFISFISPVIRASWLRVCTSAWCSCVWVVKPAIAVLMSAVPAGPIIFGAM